jgi:hypothetical protein
MIPSSKRNNPIRKEGYRPGSFPPFYEPRIYRYTCWGAFFVSSDNRGSKGTCLGFQSKLDHLSNMNPNTREGAINEFTNVEVDDVVLDTDQDSNSLSQPAKQVMVSPALIYKDSDANKSMTRQSLPEDEIIKRQKWWCLGTTNVDYLTLRGLQPVFKPVSTARILQTPPPSETIAAVAPQCNGISLRQIFTEEERIMCTIVELPLRRRMEIIARIPLNTPNPLRDWKEEAEKFYNFSLKVADHMKINANFICETLQDDFAARTIVAGKKIVARVPVTVSQTGNYMVKLVGKVWGNNNDKE